MRGHRLWGLGACVVLAATCRGFAAESSSAAGTGSEPAVAASDLQALTARIDREIAARWDDAKVRPAPAADDAEFLRRVSLDLSGRIPSASEVRAFLRDKDPQKRRRLIDRLLSSVAYVNHFTAVWRALLLPEANSSIEARQFEPSFEAWLRKQIAENVGYDQMVREIVTLALGKNMAGPGLTPYPKQGEPSPLAFYMAKDVKPENLAASTARLFLGIRLECAQCHDDRRPSPRWKREQFWSYAAFFAGIQRQEQEGGMGMVREIHDRREMAIPGKDQVVQAAFLDGSEPQWKFKVGSRVTLAEWMTAPENPFFARAVVNRMWAHFFGIGLLEPVDDLVSDAAPSHPELLDELARQFAAHQFDLKFLIRALTASRAYQLSSVATHPSQNAPGLFARMSVKGLTPEQIFDSLVQATGYREQRGALNPFGMDVGSPRAEFLARFANQTDRPTEFQTSILQALALMNGRFIADATSLERSETLAAVADAPFLDVAGQVEALYLAALSRKPRPDELARMTEYVAQGGAKGSSKSALADVFWALLNSSEFLLNH